MEGVGSVWRSLGSADDVTRRVYLVGTVTPGELESLVVTSDAGRSPSTIDDSMAGDESLVTVSASVRCGRDEIQVQRYISIVENEDMLQREMLNEG
jgi:hypothetical protein